MKQLTTSNNMNRDSIGIFQQISPDFSDAFRLLSGFQKAAVSTSKKVVTYKCQQEATVITPSYSFSVDAIRLEVQVRGYIDAMDEDHLIQGEVPKMT